MLVPAAVTVPPTPPTHLVATNDPPQKWVVTGRSGLRCACRDTTKLYFVGGNAGTSWPPMMRGVRGAGASVGSWEPVVFEKPGTAGVPGSPGKDNRGPKGPHDAHVIMRTQKIAGSGGHYLAGSGGEGGGMGVR